MKLRILPALGLAAAVALPARPQAAPDDSMQKAQTFKRKWFLKHERTSGASSK